MLFLSYWRFKQKRVKRTIVGNLQNKFIKIIHFHETLIAWKTKWNLWRKKIQNKYFQRFSHFLTKINFRNFKLENFQKNTVHDLKLSHFLPFLFYYSPKMSQIVTLFCSFFRKSVTIWGPGLYNIKFQICPKRRLLGLGSSQFCPIFVPFCLIFVPFLSQFSFFEFFARRSTLIERMFQDTKKINLHFCLLSF